MVRLIAERTHLYGTRRLKAGDEYEAIEPYADILVAARIARLAPAAAIVPAKAPTELDRLRAEARKLGIAVDGRWTAVRLNHEIAQAKQI